ncbi:dioxygenase family protein [Methylomagnum ishizawai]|nr:dioxygenase [Methylomagnum ishizawai]
MGTALAASYPLSPVLTEGPFCLDKKLLRSDVRSDSTTGETTTGFPLGLRIRIFTLNAKGKTVPLAGAYVDIWHCNALGYYSGETNNGAYDASTVDWLRGYQVTDSRGLVRFVSIYPGWYTGRTVHIHARIRLYDDAGNATYDQATQIFFDDDLTDIIAAKPPYTHDTQVRTYNATDSIYNGASNHSEIDGVTSDAGDDLLATTTLLPKRCSASIRLVIDTSEGVAGLNCPTSADNSGGGGGGGTPPTPPS